MFSVEQMTQLRGVTQVSGLVSGRSRWQANVLITLTTLHYAALHHGLEELGCASQREEITRTKDSRRVKGLERLDKHGDR